MSRVQMEDEDKQEKRYKLKDVRMSASLEALFTHTTNCVCVCVWVRVLLGSLEVQDPRASLELQVQW